MTGSKRTYLDYNASAPLRPEARAAMMAAFEAVGNPSSVHAEGRRARAIVEAAREKVAALVNAKPEDVVFTSGGTEANNLALSPWNGGPASRRKTMLYASEIEHPSVLAGGTFDVEDELVFVPLPVLPSGVLDLAAAREQLAGDSSDASDRAFMVSVMTANNETGVRQPVIELRDAVFDVYAPLRQEHGRKWVEKPSVLLHTDAVQAAGKVAVDIKALEVDLVTLSAHKIGGPKGVGALAGPGVRHLESAPLIKGGGQERRRRAGTENVPAIAGFGVAAELALCDLDDMPRVGALRDELEAGVRRLTPEAVIVGAEAPRLANTSCIALPGASAETLVIALDLAGVAVSSGSACSSGKVGRSHVLTAMRLPEALVRGAIRVSLGHENTRADILAFLAAWAMVTTKIAKSRAAA